MSAAASVPRRISTPDGVTLAVYEAGDPGSPTIVAVHGYPDDHHVWDGVVDLLADSYHVVTYDVRGAGASDRPGPRSAYRSAHLTDDLLAVLDAVSPGGPVHLLAHDWGSIQSWDALADDRFVGRVTSFTSISGPSLAYAGAWARRGLRHPRAATRQLAHSWYTLAFQLPGLPEAAARSGVIGRLARGSSGSRADAEHGLSLYRANLSGVATRTPRPLELPVQVIVPQRDPYVTSAMAAGAPQPWVADLRVVPVAGGHWVVRDRPDVIARLVDAFASDPQARPPQREGAFGGRLAVVTGGASGIGRATVLELARQGADVVVADVDDVRAKETVDEARALGVRADAVHLDVTDERSWDALIAGLPATPDVMVNNAGIGMGGTFLGTSVDDWRRILDVNLWGVIHGSRLVARLMVDRGEGGHVVNVASAAAYSPSIVYPAYATTKAAVLMLTECLRAELAPEQIGVTAVCPGFVDTDISRTTIHVGVDDAEARRRREHQVASYRRRGYPAEKVARQIVRGIRANRPIAYATPEARAFRAVSRLSPTLARRIAAVDLNKI
ncbi:alpha/beta hydrolase [Jatrophihabitans fulvus]